MTETFEIVETAEEKEQAQLAAQKRQEQRHLADMKNKQVKRLEFEQVQAMPEEQRNIYTAQIQNLFDPANVAKQAEAKARAEIETRREAQDRAEMEAEVKAIRAQFGDISSNRFQEVLTKFEQRKVERHQADIDRQILAEEHDAPLQRALYSLDKEGQEIFIREAEALASGTDTHAKAAALAGQNYQDQLHSQFMAEAQDLAANGKRYAIPKLREEFQKRGLNI
jgi:hypothetical protein